MSGPRETTIEVNGQPCRVWEKGAGEPIGFLAGFGGLPRWTPFLDRLAESRRVIAPSLPGFPGGLGHDALDTHLDWLLAAHDLLAPAGTEGADLIGVSVGGALAADVAALWPSLARRLMLVAPLGLFDEREPVLDVWGQPPGALPALLCADPDRFVDLTAAPEGKDPVEWQILQTRASEAAARLLWPVADTRLDRRLHRITQPTLLLWGSEDKVVPQAYARRFAERIHGRTTIRTIRGAGHLAELDAPDQVAEAIRDFCR